MSGGGELFGIEELHGAVGEEDVAAGTVNGFCPRERAGAVGCEDEKAGL